MVNGLDIAKATKTKLKQTLNKFPTLFSGGFGTLKMRPVDVELQEGAKPYTGRFYNIQKAYKDTAKTEVNRLCTVDILKKLSYIDNSPWAVPSFYQIKEMGNPWFLTDFIEVNKCIQKIFSTTKNE